MAGTIQRIEVGDGRFEGLWGVRVNDYKYEDKYCDMQDLLVAISKQRAVSIEQEVTPLKEIITRRNTRLDEYGKVLQVLTDLQGRWGEDARKKNEELNLDLAPEPKKAEMMDLDVFWRIMKEIDSNVNQVDRTHLKCKYSQMEGYVSRCKSLIDSMNNDSQRDMNRLQSVVDRRDESYSTATSLMSSVSDTRSSLIKNL